ncbi:MAG: Hint domain-containing protein [Rhodovarius sp.]|nr:Hint domain-containing protein [Rhodovarius sp.]
MAFTIEFSSATWGKFISEEGIFHSSNDFAYGHGLHPPFTLYSESETIYPGAVLKLGTGGPGYKVVFQGLTEHGPLFTFDSDEFDPIFSIILTNNEDSPVPGGEYPVDPDDPFILCFFPGTRLLTPAGEVAVEDLRPGDLVVTADGRSLPIRWIGRRTVHSFFADPLRSLPVRIAAGALGDGLPRRDLLLSPGHAVALGPFLANAGALVNGSSIRRLGRRDVPDRFCWYHVELDEHALLLAEGVPAESLDLQGLSERFDNAAEREALLGPRTSCGPALEMPRVITARQLPPRERERLAAIAAELGYTPAARAA